MSKIEWTDETWNPVVGCSLVSPACTNCYAMAMAARLERMSPSSHYVGTTKVVNGKAVWTGVLKQAPESVLLKPLTLKKPRRIFVNSMSDLFHESIPDEWIDIVFAVMALAPQHTFQVLTKRPKRMRGYVESANARVAQQVYDMAQVGQPLEHLGLTFAPRESPSLSIEKWPLRNVWLGVTAEDQRRAAARMPDLLVTPAAFRFVSCEPLLGAIDLRSLDINGEAELDALNPTSPADCWREQWAPEVTGTSLEEAIEGFEDWGFSYPPSDKPAPRLDLVIAGGERGPGARDNDFELNARALLAQCRAAGVPFFGKQNVGKKPLPDDLLIREFPESRR
jgi:protein gp37